MIAAGRHHHLIGLESLVAGSDHELVSIPGEPIDSDAGSNGQIETLRVGLEVVAHFIFGGKGMPRSGEGHPGQPVVAPRGEHAEGVPPLPPSVADPF